MSSTITRRFQTWAGGTAGVGITVTWGSLAADEWLFSLRVWPETVARFNLTRSTGSGPTFRSETLGVRTAERGWWLHRWGRQRDPMPLAPLDAPDRPWAEWWAMFRRCRHTRWSDPMVDWLRENAPHPITTFMEGLDVQVPGPDHVLLPVGQA